MSRIPEWYTNMRRYDVMPNPRIRYISNGLVSIKQRRTRNRSYDLSIAQDDDQLRIDVNRRKSDNDTWQLRPTLLLPSRPRRNLQISYELGVWTMTDFHSNVPSIRRRFARSHTNRAVPWGSLEGIHPGGRQKNFL
jgi:hypothetical protein